MSLEASVPVMVQDKDMDASRIHESDTDSDSSSDEDIELAYVQRTYSGGDAHITHKKDSIVDDKQVSEVVVTRVEERQSVDETQQIHTVDTPQTQNSVDTQQKDKFIVVESSAKPSEEVSTGTSVQPNIPVANNRPAPALRRSVRSRRPPEWHNIYHMSQQVPTVDIRIQIVDMLINSGVLSEVNPDTAHRLLEVVLKNT